MGVMLERSPEGPPPLRKVGVREALPLRFGLGDAGYPLVTERVGRPPLDLSDPPVPRCQEETCIRPLGGHEEHLAPQGVCTVDGARAEDESPRLTRRHARRPGWAHADRGAGA